MTLSDLERRVREGSKFSGRFHSYAQMVWPRTTKFGMVTRGQERVFRGSTMSPSQGGGARRPKNLWDLTYDQTVLPGATNVVLGHEYVSMESVTAGPQRPKNSLTPPNLRPNCLTLSDQIWYGNTWWSSVFLGSATPHILRRKKKFVVSGNPTDPSFYPPTLKILWTYLCWNFFGFNFNRTGF